MKFLSILTIIGIIISIIVIALLYKYKKKRKSNLEGMKGRTIPTKKLTEAEMREKKEMRAMNKYFSLRKKNPESSVLVVKPGINKWVDLKFKKNNKKKKSGLLEPFSIREGLENDAVNTNILKESAPKNTELKNRINDSSMEETSTDKSEAQCNALSSCTDIVGTNCGYCAATNDFYFGDSKGPKTQVCQKKDWGASVSDCIKVKDKGLCGQVTDCAGLIGEAGKKCGYCPTSGIGMVAKKSGNKFVPKYSDDICTSANGLLKNDTCSQYLRDNPCSTPQWNTGPHSDACIKKLWKNSKCTTTDKINGNNISAYKSIMKPYIEIGNTFQNTYNAAEGGGSVSKVVQFQKLCYGKSRIDPCDTKYNMNLECRQKQFLAVGCEKSGKGYPSKQNYDSWPQTKNLSQGNPGFDSSYKSDILRKSFGYKSDIQEHANKANGDAYNNNEILAKKESSLICYGDVPDDPDPMRTGDFVEYQKNGNIYQGYIYTIDKMRIGVLWTFQKINGKEYRRKGVLQSEQKKHWGWPNYPAKGGRMDGIGDKDFYVPKMDLKILQKCPKGSAVSLCNVTCYTILEELRNTYPMPRDCVVSAWGQYGACSKPCANGYPAVPGNQVRTRTVVYPARRGGIECPVLSDTRTCNPIPCKHKDFDEQQKPNFKGFKAYKVGIFNNGYIHVNQIEVYDVNGNNVARGKSATQSSTYRPQWPASNVTKAWPHNTSNFNHTKNRSSANNKKFGKNEWVIVDLNGQHEIIKIVVKNGNSIGSQPRLAGAQLLLLGKDGEELYQVEPGDARRTLKSDLTQEFLFGTDNFPYSLEDMRGQCDEVRQNDYTSTRMQASKRRSLGDAKMKEKKGSWVETTYNKKWQPTIWNWRQTYKNVLRSKPARWCRTVPGRARYYNKHIPGYYQWVRGNRWCRWAGWWWRRHVHCWGRSNYRRWKSCRWAWTRNGNYPGRWTCTYAGKRSWYWVKVEDKKFKTNVKTKQGYVDNYASIKKKGARNPSTQVRINPNSKLVEWKKGGIYKQDIDGLKTAAKDANDYKPEKTKEGNCLGSQFRLNEYYKKNLGGGDCQAAYGQRTVKSVGECAQECLNLGAKCNRFTYGDQTKAIGPTGKKGVGCRISDGTQWNNVAGSKDGYCPVDSTFASLAGNSYNGLFNETGGQVYDRKAPANGKNPPTALYPNFVGWYKDNSSRALSTRAASNPRNYIRKTFRDNTSGYPQMQGLYHQLTACSGKCSVKGKKYFGLQYWGQCFCGNDINQAKKYGKTGAESWHSQTGYSGHGYFGSWKNKIYRTKKMIYKKTFGPYQYTAKTAAAKCEKEGMVLCPKRVLVGANDSNPDRSVCSCGYTTDSSSRIYPMKYTTSGCGSKGVNSCGGGKGSAHCCQYVDENPDGKTVPT